MTFGERLRTLRKSNGLTIVQLAEMAGISDRTLQRYETDKQKPGIDIADRLAKALNVSGSELIGKDISEDDDTSMPLKFHEMGEKLSIAMAGGDIPEEDRDTVFKLISLAYAKAAILDEERRKRKEKLNNE